jgi:mitochondrial fission protein ELM1
MSAGASRIGASPASAPCIWVLTEGRAGDDAQVLELAAALDWPVRVLELRNNSNWHLVIDRIVDWMGPGRAPVRLPADAPAQWPDLVLAIAGRSVSTARRIVHASGGRTRSVHLGRPVADLASFDLVITTPQYGLPERDNVVVTPLPFCTPPAPCDGEPVAAERFRDLPRPWTALLVGGDSGSYQLGAASVARLLDAARAATQRGGSVLVTTSPRTPEPAAISLGAALPERNFFYQFRRDDPQNPYSAMLALADRFVVTGESASLIAEAVSTGRPVEIVALEEKRFAGALVRAHRWLKRGPLASLLDRLCARGLWMPPRDLGAIHAALEAAQARRASPCDSERVLGRIRALASGVEAS